MALRILLQPGARLRLSFRIRQGIPPEKMMAVTTGVVANFIPLIEGLIKSLPKNGEDWVVGQFEHEVFEWK